MVKKNLKIQMMKKSDFISLFFCLSLVISLQVYESKHWQDPHEFQILSVNPTVNLDSSRKLYWYDVKDVKGRSSRVFSESSARIGDTVIARRVAVGEGYLMYEMVFEEKS